MFLSNFGFALGTHFCGGKAVKSSVVFKHQNLHCGMDTSVSSCDDQNAQGNFIKNKCCENELQHLDTDDHFSNTPQFVNIQPQTIATLVSIFLQEIYLQTPSPTPFYTDFIPPSRNYQSLFQVYII